VGLVVCGIAVAALVIAYGEYSETHWVPPARWVGLAAYTLLIFGTLIRDFRPSWGRAGFWAMIAALLAAHLAAYAAVLRLIPDWRPATTVARQPRTRTEPGRAPFRVLIASLRGPA
jgi:hypothetical protein